MIVRTLPSLTYVVARSYPDHVIGCDNKMPWHIGTDLKKFKNLTSGHVVIMGRKTLESIGKPLPNRINIVLSRSSRGSDSDQLVWAETLENALFFADHYSILNNKSQIFVVGGANIYELFNQLFNRIYLTEVMQPGIKGDAFFRNNFDLRQWKLVSEDDYPKSDIDEFPFRITVLDRRIRTVRQIELRHFMTEKSQFDNWRSGSRAPISPLQRHVWEKQLKMDFAVPA
jgi:dihydrofolate reductase